MSKRELVVDETAPFLFTLRNGQQIDEETLFSRYRYELETLMLSAPNAFKLLGLFEQASKRAAEWIRKKFIWQKLFARDYPVEYAVAFDENAPGQMHVVHAKILDKLSEKIEGREWTLWKRYYEYIVRLKKIAKWQPFQITTSGTESDTMAYAYQDEERVFSARHKLPMTVIAYPSAEMLKKNREVICFLSSADGKENFAVGHQNHEKVLIRKINGRVPNVTYMTLDYIVNPPDPTDMIPDMEEVISPDRFFVMQLNFENGTRISAEYAFLPNVFFDTDKVRLVSSCLQCDKEAKWHWKNMPEHRFCSEPCARIAWAETMKK